MKRYTQEPLSDQQTENASGVAIPFQKAPLINSTASAHCVIENRMISTIRMNLMTWSREHDRVIAEKAEGLETTQSTNGLGVVDYTTRMTLPSAFGYFGNTDPVVVVSSIPDYSTDLAAVFRASEAWRKQDYEDRIWSITSPESGKYKTVGEEFDKYKWVARFTRTGLNVVWHENWPASAIAWSLWSACGGEE